MIYSGKTYFVYNVTSKQFRLGLFMLQSYIPDTNYTYWGNGPSWSVSVELLFYGAFLFLVRLTSRERKCLFAVLLGIVLLNSITIGNDIPNSQWFYYINPAFRLLDFLAGMLLCEWLKDTKYRPAEVVGASVLEVLSTVVLLAFVVFAAINIPEENYRFRTYYYLFPCLLVIYAFSFDMGVLSKLLGTKIFQFLGNCSFCFFMVHQIILYIVKRIWGAYIVDVRSMMHYSMIGFFCTLILSVLLHMLIERPSNCLLRNIWKRQANISEAKSSRDGV